MPKTKLIVADGDSLQLYSTGNLLSNQLRCGTGIVELSSPSKNTVYLGGSGNFSSHINSGNNSTVKIVNPFNSGSVSLFYTPTVASDPIIDEYFQVRVSTGNDIPKTLLNFDARKTFDTGNYCYCVSLQAHVRGYATPVEAPPKNTECADFDIRGLFEINQSGQLRQIGSTNYVSSLTDDVSWDSYFSVSGATGDAATGVILLLVKGAASNSVNWHALIKRSYIQQDLPH